MTNSYSASLQPTNQPAILLTNQPDIKPTSHLASQPAIHCNQPPSQPASQSVVYQYI
jgi:hypothetical protein